MDAVCEERINGDLLNGDKKHQGPKKVLIVDESEETRDVLSTALERRGVKTFTASIPRRGAVIAREEKPDLVIFDIDSVTAPPEQALSAFSKEAEIDEAPIMAIGSGKFTVPASEGEFISKPYHFLPLLEKIEQFLRSAGEVSVSETQE